MYDLWYWGEFCNGNGCVLPFRVPEPTDVGYRLSDILAIQILLLESISSHSSLTTDTTLYLLGFAGFFGASFMG